MSIKYVVMIQCDIAHRRCSGFACTDSFYNRAEKFKDYDGDVRYLSFTCGGCCGKGVAAKLEHLSGKLKKNSDFVKDQVVVHLSSCMTTDNHHYDRCPHVDYIKNIVEKKGYTQLVEGTYVSKMSNKLREKGIYHCYE